VTRTVLWLGASDDACQNYPTVLDKGTIQEYAEKCGKQKAKEWIMKKTGVDVGNCLDGNLKQSPECIANNYGIKLGVIKDGEVQWDVVVNDAGAIGGIAVCAATGAGAAAASFCGQTGAYLANIAYGIVEPFVGAFISTIFGSEEKITVCNNNYPVDLLGVGATVHGGQALARWMGKETPLNQGLPENLGPYVTTDSKQIKGYWSKILIMRGLAQASAIVLRDFAEKTGLPASKAISVLDLKAPPGWFELIRPEYDGKSSDDVRMNIGALLDSFLAPEVIRKARGQDVIVPSYYLPNFWAGIPSASSTTYYFELQNVSQNCYTAIMWGKRDPKIQKPPGPALNRPKSQVYWEYTTPVVVNALALSDNAVFQKAMGAWRASLKQNLTAKIAAGKKLAVVPTKPKSSTLPLVLAVGGAAALAWWLWPKP